MSTMEATIVGETDEGIGVDVVDNNGAAHELTLKKPSWELVYHACDEYADDPQESTEEENEHSNQAARFAKYFVFTERGYDTVEHIDNPDYVNAVRLGLTSLSDSEFEQYFGPLHQQLRSHHDESIERVVSHPAGVQKPNAVVYKQDIYLGVDIEASDLTEQARSIASAQGLDFEEGTATQSGADVTQEQVAEWREFGEELLTRADPESLELEVSAVSGIHVGFPNVRGKHEVEWAESPLDRDPDARLEVMPADPGTLAEFRAYLDHHLRCQVRDCFVGMGLVPPEEFRVVGFGKFWYARLYDHLDMYPQYHLAKGDQESLF